MSESNVPSAGTARPDAAPSETEYLFRLIANAVDELHDADLSTATLDHTRNRAERVYQKNIAAIAALRLALAEREAECERLRLAVARVLYRVEEFGRDDLAAQAFGWEHPYTDAGEALDGLRIAAGLKVDKSIATPYAIIVTRGPSAAVAPAARETQETNDGRERQRAVRAPCG